jgi:predicted thioredoxin/glutaredoxin
MEENNKLLKTLLSKNILDTNNEISVVSTDTSNMTEKEAKSITVIHKVNKREQTVDLEYWEKMKKLYGEENFEIIKYNK